MNTYIHNPAYIHSLGVGQVSQRLNASLGPSFSWFSVNHIQLVYMCAILRVGVPQIRKGFLAT